jgi:hypothetical protein
MRLLAFLVALVSFSAQAQVTPPAWEELKTDGPVEIFSIETDQPTPFLTGYIPETRTCHLLVNRMAVQPTGLEYRIQTAHEAGHCVALRNGKQTLGDLSTANRRYGETFGDIYALAWIRVNEPESLDEAYRLLVETRSRDRRQDQAYDTLRGMRTAYSLLKMAAGTGDPAAFTLKMYE